MTGERAASAGTITGPAPALTRPALKEWGAAVHALLRGRQTLLLRKGGIHEKRFTVRDAQFLLYPTVAHSHAASTRPDHADLLPLGASDVGDGTVVIRAAASVVAAIEVTRPENIEALEPLHIWTTASVQANRIDFRPRHRLTAIVVAVRPLPRPWVVPVRPESGGCRWWVDLIADDSAGAPVAGGPDGGAPARSAAELAEIADHVRQLVG
ncbi:DUF1802 family protein [Nakamurella sp.]|uniref:DUF1802 family protein n=1 Tax=Nakamurella sp. TaxID=1869182 RepID=UPI003B3BBC9F